MPLPLNDDTLLAVLAHLQPVDLARASLTCRRLSTLCMSSAVWHRQCSHILPAHVEPAAWIEAAAALHGPDASVRHASCCGPTDPAPTSYRGLYRLLVSLQPTVGYWRGLGDAPRGSLFKVIWGKDCLEVYQLQCNDESATLRMILILRIGPSYPLNVAEVVGDTNLIIRQFRGEHRTPCAAASAAAAVSTGGALLPRRSPAGQRGRAGGGPDAQVATAAATTTPPAAAPPAPDFSAEVLKFMSSQVAPPRGQARRRQRAEARSVASSRSSLNALDQQDGPAPMAIDTHSPGPSTILDSATQGAATVGSILLPPPPHAPHSAAAGSGGGAPQSHVLLAASPGGHAPLALEKAMSGGEGALSAALQQLLQSPQPVQPADQQLQQPQQPQQQLSHSAAASAAPRAGSPIARLPSGGSAGGTPLVPVGPAVHTHHFTKLQYTLPTRTHPLSGLWKGVYGPHGLEIISASYDFSGTTARVCAWKVTGDHNVPAGQDTWWASAAPQSLPWSDHELHLQEARLWLSELEPGQPVWIGGQGPGAAAAAAAPPPPQPPQPAAAAAAATNHDAPPENRPKLPKILSSHVGCGRIAGLHYSNPQWVPGRLWVLENGNISFLYMWPGSEEEPMFMVDYTRVP